MKIYKMHLLSSRSLTEHARQELSNKVQENIKQLGGSVQEVAYGNLVTLETPIKRTKSNQCWYECIFFNLSADKIADFRKELRVIEGIDRYQILDNGADNKIKANFDQVLEKDYRKRTLAFWQEHIIMENPQLLKFFLSPRGRIMPRKYISSWMGIDVPIALQHQISSAVKQARFMGWLRMK